MKETGEGDARSYDVVYDDGSRATILANTLFAAPPQVPIKCAKPNAKAKALLTKATKASAGPLKRHTSTVVRETLERLVATVAGDKAPSRRSARAPAPKKEQEAPAAPPVRATKRRKQCALGPGGTPEPAGEVARVTPAEDATAGVGAAPLAD